MSDFDSDCDSDSDNQYMEMMKKITTVDKVMNVENEVIAQDTIKFDKVVTFIIGDRKVIVPSSIFNKPEGNFFQISFTSIKNYNINASFLTLQSMLKLNNTNHKKLVMFIIDFFVKSKWDAKVLEIISQEQMDIVCHYLLLDNYIPKKNKKKITESIEQVDKLLEKKLRYKQKKLEAKEFEKMIEGSLYSRKYEKKLSLVRGKDNYSSLGHLYSRDYYEDEN